MIFQKKKVTRSLSLLHHRATYGGESKQTDPSLQPHETVYKLLTDRGKKEVARPNQPTVSSPGGRRKTNTRRPRKSSRDRRPEEKGTCSFAAKSLQASRTTSRRKESRRGLVAVYVCVCIYMLAASTVDEDSFVHGEETILFQRIQSVSHPVFRLSRFINLGEAWNRCELFLSKRRSSLPLPPLGSTPLLFEHSRLWREYEEPGPNLSQTCKSKSLRTVSNEVRDSVAEKEI